MKRFLIPLCLLALSGCASLSDPTTQVVSLEGVYTACLAAENSYLGSGKADPKVVSAIAAVRVKASAIIDPMAALAAAGTLPANVLVTDATVAVEALQAVLQSFGLMTAVPAGSN